MNRTQWITLTLATALLFGGCGDDDGATDSGPVPDADVSGDAGDDAQTDDTGIEPDMTAGGPTCEAYCGAVTTSCTGENAQYADASECEAHCDAAGWEAGMMGATDGNTIGCRGYHAGVAGTMMPEVHCAHAGPSGGDVCGSWCENYCDLEEAHCTGGDSIYDDRATCMTACEGFAADGTAGDTDGDSVQCRIYHLGAPAAMDAATHCAHGAVDGGGVCVAPAGPTCEAYCGAVTASCTGANAQYGTQAECMTYCNDIGGWDAGEMGATDGNSIGCRGYHAGVAGTMMPEVHCAHAGPSGGDVCGGWCENYCGLAMNNCTGANALYDDMAGCMTACDGFSTAGAAGDTDGDSVQCRIYHSGAPAAGNPATHCAHAAVDGGGVCVAGTD